MRIGFDRSFGGGVQRASVVSVMALAMGGVGLFCGGCATYVNIPPLSNNLSIDDPNASTVREVQIAALQAVVREYPPAGPLTIRLPERTKDAAYEQILAQVSESAQRVVPGAVPLLDVRQIRVRSWYAQVDVVRSSPQAPAMLLTSTLRWEGFAGWQHQRLRVWRMPVTEALFESRRQAETQISE